MPTSFQCKSDISVEYALALLKRLEERGVDNQQVLGGTGLTIDRLRQTLRLSTDQDAALLSNAAHLTGDFGIGFDLGVSSSVTTHGFLGYGLMSCATLGEALSLWMEFLDIRTTSASARIRNLGALVELQIGDLASHAPMRESALDRLTTMTARLCTLLTGQSLPGMEIWLSGPRPSLSCPESTYFETARFATGLHQLRIPSLYLELRLPTANPMMLKKVREQCEQERLQLTKPENLVLRVKDVLTSQHHGYPNLEATAKALHVSSRTLKRKLQLYGLSFRALVEEVRKSEVLRDLLNSALSIDAIATRAGYADPANLTRAFRRWTGHAPSQYRATFTAN